MNLDDRERIFRAERAASWSQRLTRAGRNERAMFVRWLRQSPQNVADMLREAELDFALEHVDPKRRLDVEELAARHHRNVLSLRGASGVSDPGEASNVGRWAARPVRGAPSTGWKWVAAAAASAALALGLLILVVRGALLERIIATEASEWRNVTFADGSIVRLGPRTRLRVDFSDTTRLVVLEQGEALFEVTRDPDRPFLVDGGAGMARALGTQFGVARNESGLLITVVEGRVFVTRTAEAASGGPRHAAGGGVQLSAGQQIGVSAARMTAVHRVDARQAVSWAQKRLIFRTETVAQASAQFNRRNRLQILIEDAALASLPMRGAFDADDPETFAGAVAAATGAKAVRDGENALRLTLLEASRAAQTGFARGPQ